VHGEKWGVNFLYTAREILYRLNEISFNSSLMREMSGINTLSASSTAAR
jgi:hypothetical protein